MSRHEQFIYSKSGRNLKKMIPYLQKNNFNIDILCKSVAIRNIKINEVKFREKVFCENTFIPKNTEGIMVCCYDINAKSIIPLRLRKDIKVVDMDYLCDFNYSSMFQDKRLNYKGKSYFSPLTEEANNMVNYTENKNCNKINDKTKKVLFSRNNLKKLAESVKVYEKKNNQKQPTKARGMEI